VEPADLPTPHHPRFSSLFFRKCYVDFVIYKFRARGLTSLTCEGRAENVKYEISVRNVYVICKQRARGQGSEPREGGYG